MREGSKSLSLLLTIKTLRTIIKPFITYAMNHFLLQLKIKLDKHETNVNQKFSLVISNKDAGKLLLIGHNRIFTSLPIDGVTNRRNASILMNLSLMQHWFNNIMTEQFHF